MQQRSQARSANTDHERCRDRTLVSDMKNQTTIGLLLLATLAGACNSKPAPSETVGAEPQAAKPEQAAAKAQPAVGAGYELDRPEAPKQAEPSAAAPVEKAAAKPVHASANQGPAATGEGFSVHMQAASSYVAGKPSQAEVVLSAQAPFHCNEKYPYKLALEASPGISYPEQTVRGMSIGQQTSTMAVPFTASSPGKHTLSGQLSFSVCTDDKCLVEKQKVSVTIDVKGAS